MPLAGSDEGDLLVGSVCVCETHPPQQWGGPAPPSCSSMASVGGARPSCQELPLRFTEWAAACGQVLREELSVPGVMELETEARRVKSPA